MSVRRKGHPSADLAQQIRANASNKAQKYTSTPFKIPARFVEDDLPETQPIVEEISSSPEESPAVKSLSCNETLDTDVLDQVEGGEDESDDVDEEAEFRDHVYEYAMGHGIQETKHLIALCLARAEKKLKTQRPIKRQKV